MTSIVRAGLFLVGMWLFLSFMTGVNMSMGEPLQWFGLGMVFSSFIWTIIEKNNKNKNAELKKLEAKK